ncbi:MAG: grasp-with-spasm system ATP-grasp peptide maturase [Bacteroidia bacterium]
MILILTEDNEHNADRVIDWIVHFQGCFIRINREEPVSLQNLHLGKEELENDVQLSRGSDESVTSLNSINAYWYRRGQLCFEEMNNEVFQGETALDKEIRSHLRQEISTVEHFIYHWLQHRVRLSIGSFQDIHLNKLSVLTLAQSCGLSIPETCITGSSARALMFYNSARAAGNEIISKSINNSPYFILNSRLHMAYTERVEPSSIVNKPPWFFPSLFQMEIRKKYDLRIFYLQGVFYTMAILSQAGKQTTTDFRKYDFKKPNRKVPFNLPDKEEQKLRLLMNKLSLHTGSIDMIAAEDGAYYFLEVNPLGQFGMVAAPCNYPIYELHALALLGIKTTHEKEPV